MSSVLDKIRWPDLGGMFSGFSDSFAQGQQLEMQRQQLTHKQKIEEERQRMLREKMEQAEAEKQAEVQRQKELLSTKAAYDIGGKLEQYKVNPELYKRAYMQLVPSLANTFKQIGVPGDAPPNDPALYDDWARKQRAKITAATDPKQWKEFQQKAADLVAAWEDDPTLADPQHARANPQWDKALNDVMFGIPAAGATRVSQSVTGPHPLSPPTRAASEQKIIGGIESLGSLNRAAQLAKPEHFTRTGRMKGAVLDEIAQWMGGETPPNWSMNVETRKQLSNELDQFFNSYRKYITGAQASERELELLKESIVNKNVSWPQFKAGLEQFQTKMKREIRLHNYLLRNGIPENVESTFASLLNTKDDFSDPDYARIRYDQLVAEGITDKRKIREILLTEGYRLE